jgi:hypothetical protein
MTTCSTPPPQGACCYVSGEEAACDVTDQKTCDREYKGQWQGAGTDCGINQCAVGGGYFDAGNEGWWWAHLKREGPYPTVFDSGDVNWNSTGGNPGGCISIYHPYGWAVFFVAPAAFLGDQSAAYGQSLRYDMKVSSGAGDGYSAIPDLVLVGAGKCIVKRFGTVALSTEWASFALLLTEDGWTYDKPDNTTPVTAEDFHAVLADLTALYLCADYVNGLEMVYLDNVVLGN